MKATDLLKQQHREVEMLFARIEKTEGMEKMELVRELAAKLATHMRIEEEMVYPLARETDEDHTMEALEEHTVAAFALKRLAEAGVDHETADAKIKTLKELVQHHVREEESTMLPQLERQLGRDRNEQLGEELEERFESILESGYGGDLFGRRNGHARRARMRGPRMENRARS